MKHLAIGYAIKTLILAIACLAIPDLPRRAMQAAHDTWTRIAGVD